MNLLHNYKNTKMKKIKFIINVTLVLITLMILFICYAFFVLNIHHFIFGLCFGINVFLFGKLLYLNYYIKGLYSNQTNFDPGSFEEVKNDLIHNKTLFVNKSIMAIYEYEDDHLFVNIIFEVINSDQEDIIIQMISLIENVDFKKISYLNLNAK